MDKEQAKAEAKGYLEEYLQKKGIDTKKNFRCLAPGHTDKHPSMSYVSRDRYGNGPYCYCHTCHAKYDIFDLVGMDFNLSDIKEVFNKTYEMYDIKVDSPGRSNQPEKKTPEKATEEKPRADKTSMEQIKYNDYIESCKKRIEEKKPSEYLKKRGISMELAKKFSLGYDDKKAYLEENEDGQGKYTIWEALIIPTGANSYVARNIKEDSKGSRYRKIGASNILNVSALWNSEQPIFVAEGEIDAISIMSVGGVAIGLGSVANYHKLISVVKENKPTQPLILALDNDTNGIKTEDELAKELKEIGIPFYRHSLYGVSKDANEALLVDGEVFKKKVEEAIASVNAETKEEKETEKEKHLKESASYYIEDFFKKISERADTPATSTGFINLDEILDGGLYPGLYIMGAISSLGKTTFMLQMADNIAKNGQDVIFISLEMARTELMAKSISRLTYQNDNDQYHRNAKTTRGITTGSRYKHYTDKEKQHINASVNEYAEYAKHIFIYEGMGNIRAEEVRKVVEKHVSVMGTKPVVIIDYLQILAPSDVRASDKQNMDKTVLELKRLSRDIQIPVIAISSFNRESYKNDGSYSKGEVQMADFKESGAIEYSADVLIGLQFQNAGGEYSEKTEKSQDIRKIELVVLKNRNGRAWVSARYDYNPKYNLFIDTSQNL